MKFVIVIPDGCADQPQSTLGNLTPLQAAKLPSMDSVARRGRVGRANHTPAHLTAGSAVANMSLLGYDPNANFTGRAPLEAAAQGIEMGPDDWAIRCNLVTIVDQVMKDFTADHISSDEARELLETATANTDNPPLEFVPGVSYRNLLLHRGTDAPFSNETRSTPPHDLTDKRVADHFPRGPGSAALSELMSQSVNWFANHPVNQQRIQAGKLPATNLWLWGLGQRPKLESFDSLHGLQGAMITAVDLLRGLAALIGWQRIEVPGATGYIDTDYRAKGQYAQQALENFDLVCVHIEAPDEASHEGNVEKKVAALQEIDHCIIGPLLAKLEQHDEWRILITPDHPTFLSTKTHSHGDVPFTVCGSDIQPDDAVEYSESPAAASDLEFPNGFELMPRFVNRDGF